MFRRRHRTSNGHMSPAASLEQAQAARRAQERKQESARQAAARISRLAEENDIAARFLKALSGGDA